MHGNSQVPPALRKRIEIQIFYSPRSALRRLPTSVGVQTRAANFGAPRRPLSVIARESALDFDHCQRAAHMLIRTSPRQLFLSFSPRALAFSRFFPLLLPRSLSRCRPSLLRVRLHSRSAVILSLATCYQNPARSNASNAFNLSKRKYFRVYTRNDECK